MLVRKSPTFVKLHRSSPGIAPCRILPSGYRGLSRAAHAKVGRQRPARDLRLTIFEVPPPWPHTNMLAKVRTGVLTPRDVKNEDRTDYVHENKGKMTKCTPLKPAFYTKIPPLCDCRPHRGGLLGRNSTDCVAIRGQIMSMFGSCPRRSEGLGPAELNFGVAKCRAVPLCNRNKKSYPFEWTDLQKCMLLKLRWLTESSRRGRLKRSPSEIDERSRNAVENKGTEKIDFCLPIISLKIIWLFSSFHYIHERKGS
jgi:hypothetical protein